MEIGEKIRSLRQSKHMTQSELAGDQITRNMLSLVENGSALPSLPTIIYLSERLGISAGMLLAREDEEAMYRKLSEMPNIKHLFSSGEYRLCCDICESLPDDQIDDELYLILAKCNFELAKENFYLGKLHNSARQFDKACEYSRKTIYAGDVILASASIYFDYMIRLSPTLSSEFGNDIYEGGGLHADPFCKYALSIKAYDEGNYGMAFECLKLMSGDKGEFSEHILARREMSLGDHVSARKRLKKLINGDIKCCVIMYDIFKDLEECCRLTDDYKGAYEYSVGKVDLLEHMLREDPL